MTLPPTSACWRLPLVLHWPGAAGVALAGSGWPDIAAGAVIALWFLRSALNVMGQAWPAWRAAVKSSGERGTG